MHIGCLSCSRGDIQKFSIAFFTDDNRIIYISYLDTIRMQHTKTILNKYKINKVLIQKEQFFIMKQLKCVETIGINRFDYNTNLNINTDYFSQCCISALVYYLGISNFNIERGYLPDRAYTYSNVNEDFFNKINFTLTNYGKRKLEIDYNQPLIDIEKIKDRHTKFQIYRNNNILANNTEKLFKELPDIEKIIRENVCNADIRCEYNSTQQNNNSFESKKPLDKLNSTSTNRKLHDMNIDNMQEKKNVSIKDRYSCNNKERNCFKETRTLKDLRRNISSTQKIYKFLLTYNKIQKLLPEYCKLNTRIFLEPLQKFINAEMINSNNFANLFKEDVNEYLDLAIKIYRETLDLLNKYLEEFTCKYNFKIIRNENQEVYIKIDNHEITKSFYEDVSVLPFSNINKPSILCNSTEINRSRTKELCTLIKHKTDSVNMDRNPKQFISESSSYKPLTDKKSDSISNSKKRASPVINFSESYEDRNKLIFLSNKRNHYICTTPDIQSYNYKIKEVYDQIIEIGGNLCESYMNSDLYKLTDFIEEISEIDVCLCIYKFSMKYESCIPTYDDYICISDSYNIMINSQVVYNDYYICDKLYYNIVTGNNMSGKSTYIKQLYYMILLNQLGYPIPAKSAILKIFNNLYLLNEIQALNKVLLEIDTQICDQRCSDIQIGESRDSIQTEGNTKNKDTINTFEMSQEYNAEEANKPSTSIIDKDIKFSTLLLVDEIGKGLDYSFLISYYEAISRILIYNKIYTFLITHHKEIINSIKHMQNVNVLKNVNHKVSSGVCVDTNVIDLCRLLFNQEIINDLEKEVNTCTVEFNNKLIRLALRILRIKTDEDIKEICKHIKKFKKE